MALKDSCGALGSLLTSLEREVNLIQGSDREGVLSLYNLPSSYRRNPKLPDSVGCLRQRHTCKLKTPLSSSAVFLGTLCFAFPAAVPLPATPEPHYAAVDGYDYSF